MPLKALTQTRRLLCIKNYRGIDFFKSRLIPYHDDALLNALIQQPYFELREMDFNGYRYARCKMPNCAAET